MNTSKLNKILFDQATIGILVVNNKGQIESINPFALKMFGYQLNELLKHPIDLLIPERFHPRIQRQINISLKKNNHRQINMGVDLVAIKKNRVEFPVEISFGIFEDDGEKMANIYIVDISIRKNAEMQIVKLDSELESKVEYRTHHLKKALVELEHSKMELQRALEFQKILLFNVKAIFFTFDLNGIIQTFNPEAERELGYEAAEVIGKKNPFIFQDKDCLKKRAKEISKEVGRKISAGIEIFRVKSSLQLYEDTECIYVRKDGIKFPVQLNVSPMKDSFGTVIGYVGVAINISKIKEVELALKEALDKEKELNEIITRFVTTASHEFRTPLSTILSSTYLLGKYCTFDEQLKRENHITRIISSVDTLIKILDDLLSVGKIEEGGIHVKAITINIKEFVLNLSSQIINSLKLKQKIRCTHIGKENVEIDETLLKHILFNLISNASKFSPEASQIEIKSVFNDKQFKLSVKDYGIGISKQDQKHLTKRFFRGTNAATIQGTGLGLHIVQKYVEILKGDFKCISKLNYGTEFILIFQIK
jgi:PAS domain S-box-containing protein